MKVLLEYLEWPRLILGGVGLAAVLTSCFVDAPVLFGPEDSALHDMVVIGAAVITAAVLLTMVPVLREISLARRRLGDIRRELR